MLAICRRVLGLDTRDAAGSLANVLIAQGQSAEAAELYREILAAVPAEEQERDPANTQRCKPNLASALTGMGDHEEAEAMIRDWLSSEEHVHGLDDVRMLETATMLGGTLQRQGKHTEAEAVCRPTLAAQRLVLGPGHPNTLRTAGRAFPVA